MAAGEDGGHGPDPTVIELQERVAFLERDIETLDGVVRELADRLDATGRELARLRDDTRGRLDDVEQAASEAMSARVSGDSESSGLPSDDASGADGSSTPGDAYTRDMPPHWGRATGRSGD